MVHLKNLKDGVKDTSRGGMYHNKRFRETAEQHGLIINKGKYGWHVTTLQDETLAWIVATFVEQTAFDLYRDKPVKLSAGSKKQSTRKYVCPICGTIVRATKEVNITCTDCSVDFMRE